jgi:phage tail sheath protein FI
LRDVSFDFGSEDTDAALLNAAGITTLVRFGGGYRYWGNRTCSTNRSMPSKAWCAPRR